MRIEPTPAFCCTRIRRCEVWSIAKRTGAHVVPKPVRARRVIIAKGRSGKFRKLNVSGEELEKVRMREDGASSRGDTFIYVLPRTPFTNRSAMTQAIQAVTVATHPLIEAKLATLRTVNTATEQFRSSLQEISILLLAQASERWETTAIELQTPLQRCQGVVLLRPVVLVPILRAGVGMLDGMLRVLPDAQVGHLGLYRDERTLRPVSYYRRLPSNIAEAEVLLLDPMLATGHSASEAVNVLKTYEATSIRFVCIVACPEGIAQLQSAHPEIPIITAVIDSGLNASGYIVPGLGDAGDRYFGT